MNISKTFNKVLGLLIFVNIIFFFSSFGFQDSQIQGWYLQTFPNLNGSNIIGFDFLDSLTGFAVTNSNTLLQQYILKTTNGGDNWAINYTFKTPNSNWSFVKIGFVNSTTGFAFSWTEMFKTTNCGATWDMVTNKLYPNDIAIINKDTILAVKNSGLDGGVYRSIDGGYNFQFIWGPTGINMPNSIYMYNSKFGFHIMENSNGLRRTTDGGVTWTVVPNERCTVIQMLDTLIGWKVYGDIRKTTDGGLTWFVQNTPTFSWTDYKSLSILNKDTVWAVGPSIYRNNTAYGPLLITTNGGTSWGYQIADSLSGQYLYINFINRKYGWAFPAFVRTNEIHTRIGGNDTTFFTAVNSNVSEIPNGFELFQNYPNPFNQMTNIKYQITSKSFINLRIFDITGKEITTLINEEKQTGMYSVRFDSGNLSSGIYFYIMSIDGKTIDVKKMVIVR